jgi:hypothetical protein
VSSSPARTVVNLSMPRPMAMLLSAEQPPLTKRCYVV